MSTYLTQHPVFKSNQLLTSLSLNTSFDYTDQQGRITRILQSRIGILTGLNYEVGVNSGGAIETISIKGGAGYSTDGYCLAPSDESGNFVGDFVYTGVKKYVITRAQYKDLTGTNPIVDEGDGIALPADVVCMELRYANQPILSSSPNANELTLALNLPFAATNTNYLLALFLEITETQEESCNVNSCDSGGTTRHMRVVPLLVPMKMSSLELFKRINTPIPILKTMHVKRLFDLQSCNTVQKFYRATHTLAIENLTIIKEALTAIPLQYSEFSEFAISGTDRNNMILKLNTLIGHAQAAYNLAGTVGTSNIHNVPLLQTYDMFTHDLAKAHFEFVSRFNSVAVRFQSAWGYRLKRFLVLGMLQKTEIDPYRYYPVALEDLEVWQNEYNTLIRMYERMFIMIDKFLPTPVDSSGIPSTDPNTLYNRVRKAFYPPSAPPPSPPAPAPGSDTWDPHAIGDFKLVNIRINTSIIGVLAGLLMATKEVKLVPTRRAPSKLGETALPYYYNLYDLDLNNKLLMYWKAGLEDEKNMSDIYTLPDELFPTTTNRYKYSTYTNYNLDEYPAYRVEGLAESTAPWQTIVNKLVTEIRRQNLSIGVLTVNVTPGTDGLSFIPGSSHGIVSHRGTIIVLVANDRVVGHHCLEYFMFSQTLFPMGTNFLYP